MKRVIFVILIVLAASTFFIATAKYSTSLTTTELERYSDEELLRLHVIANSNSLEDQRIKREVRNEIIKNTSHLFINIKDPSQAPKIVINNMDTIRNIVKKTIGKYDKDYGINLKFGIFKFPTRSYGEESLTAGNYQALKVILGAGNGENWWCVLFPPLCFVDSMDKLSKDDIQELSKAEEIDQDILDVKFKLKLIEFLKDNPKFVKAKVKLVNILETSFPGLNKLLFPENEKER